MNRKRYRKWWRWEKHLPPDGYTSTHFGRMMVQSVPPPKGRGWERVRVRSDSEHPGQLEYLEREAW